MDATHKLHYGLEMESQGARWLESRFPSLSLLAKNYRWKGGELDLVYEDHSRARAVELVFVEVRARKPGALVDAVASITLLKQRRLARTIEHFLSRYKGPAQSIRLDVLAWDGKGWDYLKNVRLEGAGAGRYH
jgi:putative endonuclease